MSLFNKLERVLGRFAIPGLSLYLVMAQVGCWALVQFDRLNPERIALVPAAVRAGEIWRLVTFLFLPPSFGSGALDVVFLAFAWYLFFLMGSALEGYWGAFRYNLFIGLGWLLTAAAAWLTPLSYATNLFLAGSVFLAFAFLNPDFEMLIFFILPVKIKWLALITWIGYGYKLAVGSWPTRFMVLASIGNFLVFFAGDIVQRIRTGRRRMSHQAKVFAAAPDEKEPRHRCHVCGKTDLTDPLLDFRYCSKCAGDQCYCPEHIFNHVHMTSDDEKKKPS
jgi:Pyruvate/2-oxoacid:ferredoxin oxidoreductase delta subunit